MSDEARIEPSVDLLISGALNLSIINKQGDPPGFILDCIFQLRWVMPTLLHLLDSIPDSAPPWFQAHPHNDRAATLSEINNILNRLRPTPLRLHGWLMREPLLCALATSTSYVDARVHGALIAAILVVRLKTPSRFDENRCYAVGLELRRLAEPLRDGSGRHAYAPPDDLDSLDSAEALLDRLPVALDTRPENETFSGHDGDHTATLVRLGTLLRETARPFVNPDRTRPSSSHRGQRGPGGDESGLTQAEDLRELLGLSYVDEQVVELANDDRQVPPKPRVFIRSPALNQLADDTDEDEDELWHEGGNGEASAEHSQDVCLWPTGSARIELPLPRRTSANERRLAIASVSLPLEKPAEDFDDGENLWIRLQRLDLGMAQRWWDWHQLGEDTPWRRTRLALTLVSALGVGLNNLSKLALCTKENKTRPGLRLYCQDALVTGVLEVPLPDLAAPITEPKCDRHWLHPTVEIISLPIHPAIAAWLAQALTTLGAHWLREDAEGVRYLTGMPRMKWKHMISAMANGLASLYPGMRATAGHTMGIHLAALAQAGTTDPGLTCLAAPWMFSSPSDQTLYTNAPLSLVREINLRTQVRAWKALTGQELDLNGSGIALKEGRVGARRCLTTAAVRKAHALLRRDVALAGRHRIRNAHDAAKRINSAVLLTVFELTATRGLRARRNLWQAEATLSVTSAFWTFCDKGNHLRSLPLDAVDLAALSRLADALREGRHPSLPDTVLQSLSAGERSLRGERTGSRSLSIGQLVMKKGLWVWRPVCMMDLYKAWAAHGVLMHPSGLRYAARSVLAAKGFAPGAVNSLLGHHAWGLENFRPLRATSGPWLRDATLPLIHHLRGAFLSHPGSPNV